MTKTVKGVTYGDLDTALRQMGYIREDRVKERIYRTERNPDAFVSLPQWPFDQEIWEAHLLAARQIPDAFGVYEGHDFDLLLLRVTHKDTVPTPA